MLSTCSKMPLIFRCKEIQNKNNCALYDRKMCSSECPWEREILLLLAWLFCIYIYIYIYISKTTNYCRGFGCCSYYSGVRNVEPWWQDESWLTTNLFSDMVKTLGNRGDWLWKTGKQQKWKQRCCSLSLESYLTVHNHFFLFTNCD